MKTLFVTISQICERDLSSLFKHKIIYSEINIYIQFFQLKYKFVKIVLLDKPIKRYHNLS